MSINSESEWQAASQPSSEMGRRRTVLFRSSMPSSPQHSSTVTPTLRASETDPLLSQRPFGRHFNSSFGHTPPSEPTFSCHTNHHSNIPVYTNIHRIKRDIESVVEDYLSLDQLLDVRVNLAVVRPLVDKLDDEEDISIGMFFPIIISSSVRWYCLKCWDRNQAFLLARIAIALEWRN